MASGTRAASGRNSNRSLRKDAARLVTNGKLNPAAQASGIPTGFFTAEAPQLADLIARFAHDRLIDIACGTAFWLPRYAAHCSDMTLFDQSERMLNEAKRKTHDLGIADRCSMSGTFSR